jgi:hypothetical protein
MGPQSCESPNLGNFETPNLGIMRQNDIWVLIPWPCTKNIIRGKVVASPEFRLWWVLWIVFACDSSMQQKCSNYSLTNFLFGLCKFVWIIDLLVTHPSPHPGAPTRPSTPEVLQAKERVPTPYPFIVFTLDSHLNLSRSLGCVAWGQCGPCVVYGEGGLETVLGDL